MTTLKSRREFLLCVDGRTMNPNGDWENRPRHFPDGTGYVSADRCKRNGRDQFHADGHHILVAPQGGKVLTMKAAFAKWAKDKGLDAKDKVKGHEHLQALCETFLDIRAFGCALAQDAVTFTPKSLTGPMQISVGRVFHKTHEEYQKGSTVMAGGDGKEQGTTYSRRFLRYAFYGWNGVVNENNAQQTGLTEEDYNYILAALPRSFRNTNTQSKMGQAPRFLVSITNVEGNEHQFGNLLDYVELVPTNGIPENQWTSPFDFRLDISLLIRRINQYKHCIAKVEFNIDPDMRLTTPIPDDWEFLNLDEFPPNVITEVLQEVVQCAE